MLVKSGIFSKRFPQRPSGKPRVCSDETTELERLAELVVMFSPAAAARCLASFRFV